jgi:hypothetical protein
MDTLPAGNGMENGLFHLIQSGVCNDAGGNALEGD